MTVYRIPFNKPALVGNEFLYMARAISEKRISGDGGFTRKCENLIVEALGVGRALLTTSCTHALEMTALLLNIRPGDEVIVPSFTFVSTVNAFVLRGAVPVFADIRPDTLNLDEERLEGLITSRTKAIIVVHYAGVGCEMDTILEIAGRHGVAVCEDNAHGLFGKYRGRFLGSLGVMATLSFHETKNITCGEGGALLINDPRYLKRAEVIREKGTNRSRFFRGETDKYSWIDLGSSYLPADLLAAFLYGQLEAREQIQSRRRLIWQTYDRELQKWAHAHEVRLPFVPQDREQPYHMYYLVLPTLAQRDALIAYLKDRGILSTFHYLPLHLSKMGALFGGCAGLCPVTESISDRLIRLPLYAEMTPSEQEQVLEAITSFESGMNWTAHRSTARSAVPASK